MGCRHQCQTRRNSENFSRQRLRKPFWHGGDKTDSEDQTLKIIEATSFRLEGKYTDKRHPDEIKFAKTIEEDLARRDFTVNAMAAEIQFEENIKIVDPFDGQKDLKNKIIRTVGEPSKRFNEDALRLMRAVRFSAELNFEIEEKTAAAIKEEAHLLAVIAKERICDELEKIIITERAAEGVQKLKKLNLLPILFRN